MGLMVIKKDEYTIIQYEQEDSGVLVRFEIDNDLIEDGCIDMEEGFDLNVVIPPTEKLN